MKKQIHLKGLATFEERLTDGRFSRHLVLGHYITCSVM